MKVFICEDDSDIRELLTILVKELEFDVISCSEESEIEGRVRTSQPDLIIIDYWLEHKTAEEIIKTLKQDPNLTSIPIVLISAINNLEEIGQELTVDAIIKKPFDIDQFQTTIRSFLK